MENGTFPREKYFSSMCHEKTYKKYLKQNFQQPWKRGCGQGRAEGGRNIRTPFHIWDQNIFKLRYGSPFLKYWGNKNWGGGSKMSRPRNSESPPNC